MKQITLQVVVSLLLYFPFLGAGLLANGLDRRRSSAGQRSSTDSRPNADDAEDGPDENPDGRS